MNISTARRYKCNISDWIAFVTSNILEMGIFDMTLLLEQTELHVLSFQYIQDSLQTV